MVRNITAFRDTSQPLSWKRPTAGAVAGRAPLGKLQHPLNPNARGLLRANVAQNVAHLDLSYLGPDDLWTN